MNEQATQAKKILREGGYRRIREQSINQRDKGITFLEWWGGPKGVVLIQYMEDDNGVQTYADWGTGGSSFEEFKSSIMGWPIPDQPQLVVAVAGNGYWGKGRTLEDAMERIRSQGATGTTTVSIYLYTGRQPELDKVAVDSQGSISYPAATVTSTRVGLVKMPMKQTNKKKGPRT